MSPYCLVQFQFSFLLFASKRALVNYGSLKMAANSLLLSLFRGWICDPPPWILGCSVTARTNRKWQKRHYVSFQLQAIRNWQFLYPFSETQSLGALRHWKKASSPGTNMLKRPGVSSLVNSPSWEQPSSQGTGNVTEAVLDSAGWFIHLRSIYSIRENK